MAKKKESNEKNFQLHLESKFEDSELFIALVHSLGTNHKHVIDELTTQLKHYNYEIHVISMTTNVIEELFPNKKKKESEYERFVRLIDSGNQAREEFGYNGILSLGAINAINTIRGKTNKKRGPLKKTAFIITSLKHKEEVRVLRKVYGSGFYLIGVFSEEKERKRFLEKKFRMSEKHANELIHRDTSEAFDHGQQTSEAFHLADFFVHYSHDIKKLNADVERILGLLFGCPTITPTFDEYAMFMAFSAASRSADLSRQVGAVIAKENEILATGANDCPSFGGGQYWPSFSNRTYEYEDFPKGRDYKRGFDSNSIEKSKIFEELISRVKADISLSFEKLAMSLKQFEFEPKRAEIGKEEKSLLKLIQQASESICATIPTTIKNSSIQDLTEYGRVVHAEMSALLSCARMGTSTQAADLYCTTFPCHNCAKHIISAGIKRVVFVEPYTKSKTLEFHNESVILGLAANSKKVNFAPFVGVGARRFIDLFSMSLGMGDPIKRKDKQGKVIHWRPDTAKLRTQLLPSAHIDNEHSACLLFSNYLKVRRNDK